jgi:hypothetical protein
MHPLFGLPAPWHTCGLLTSTRRIAIVLLALVILLMGVCGWTSRSIAEERITSLFPSCAAPGDPVVLMGKGLGALNQCHD